MGTAHREERKGGWGEVVVVAERGLIIAGERVSTALVPAAMLPPCSHRSAGGPLAGPRAFGARSLPAESQRRAARRTTWPFFGMPHFEHRYEPRVFPACAERRPEVAAKPAEWPS